MKNKKNKSLYLMIILIISITFIGLSFAYFVAQISSPANTNVNIGSEVSEKLIFTPGNALNLNASQANFAEGSGSISSDSTSSATLIANSTTNNASDTYQIYFKINSNDFIYTTEQKKAELLLKVIDPDGNEVTSIEGLSYKTVVDASTSETITGFDITTFEGLIKIKEDQIITSTDSVDGFKQNWKVEVTFVNLDTNQILNEGKFLDASFILQKEKLKTNRVLQTSIIEDNGGEEYIASKSNPDYSTNSTTNEGVFKSTDNYGASYYYRGEVDNNWVYFAGFYWRIIRVNGDDSVRLIYSGSTAPTEAEKAVMKGTKTLIGTSTYNPSPGGIEYVGYMYTENYKNGYTTNSVLKSYLDEWYVNNIEAKGYDEYIADSLFCNDREGFKYNHTLDTYEAINVVGPPENFEIVEFGSNIRIASHKPTLHCLKIYSSFTVNDTTNGNGNLTYPIGTITAEEVVYAGHFSSKNENTYLYVGENYWTMTPYNRNPEANYYTLYEVATYGFIGNAGEYSSGVRPVISIKSNIMVDGIGTYDDPYIVKY